MAPHGHPDRYSVVQEANEKVLSKREHGQKIRSASNDIQRRERASNQEERKKERTERKKDRQTERKTDRKKERRKERKK